MVILLKACIGRYRKDNRGIVSGKGYFLRVYQAFQRISRLTFSSYLDYVVSRVYGFLLECVRQYPKATCDRLARIMSIAATAMYKENTLKKEEVEKGSFGRTVGSLSH